MKSSLGSVNVRDFDPEKDQEASIRSLKSLKERGVKKEDVRNFKKSFVDQRWDKL